jgi:2-aminoadipate transaminase
MSAHTESRTEPSPGAWLFEAGIPDPATFPTEDVARLTADVLRDEPDAALQYGMGPQAPRVQGYEGLRGSIAGRLAARDGRSVDRDQVVVTSGAVQALTLTFAAYLGPGDVIAVEAPTWNRVLAWIQHRGARAVPVPVDGDGMRLDVLEQHLAACRDAGRPLAAVYAIATFNTPTGVSLSTERRRRLVELAAEWGFLLIEDNVYAELRYDGERLPSMFGQDRAGRVLQLDSLSKVVAPGLRIGWAAGPPEIVDRLVGVRADLGVSQLLARVMDRYLREGLLDPHIAEVTTLYRRKRDVAAAALREHCGDRVRFGVPEGGMFLWVELDAAVDPAGVIARAADAGVSVRAGERFFGDGGGRRHFRLAYSYVPEAELERGIAALGAAIAGSASTTNGGGRT